MLKNIIFIYKYIIYYIFLSENTLEIAKMKEQINKFTEINQSDLSIFYCKSVKELEDLEIEFQEPTKYDQFVSIYKFLIYLYVNLLNI